MSVIRGLSGSSFPYFRTFLTSMGFFSVNLAFSVYTVYVPIFLRNNLIAILGDSKIIFTLVGIIMVIDNIAAIILQPIIGKLSDRIWIKKIGRRMPFIIIGIPLAALFFGLIGTFESMFYLLLFAICGFNICMALYNTPVLTLIPDTLSQEHISLGNSVLNIVGGLANITGLLLSSFLYARNHQLAFWVMAIIMVMCLIILILNVREKKEIDSDYSEEHIKIKDSLRVLFKGGNLVLILLLIVVFMHNAGYQIAETFFSSYAEQFLSFSADKAANIMGVFLVIQIVLSIPAGLLTKKIGAINASLIGVIGFLAGFIPLSIISFTDTTILGSIITLNNLQFSWEFLVYSVTVIVMGFGWILLFMNLLLAVWTFAPKGKTATFTSYYYVFWNLAAVCSPLIAGGIFDLITNLTKKDGLRVLFLLVSSFYVIALILLFIVRLKLNLQLRALDFKDEQLDVRLKEKNIPLKFLPLVLFGIGLRKETDFKKIQEKQTKEKRNVKAEIKSIRKSKPLNPIKIFVKDEDEIKRKHKLKEKKQKRKDLMKVYRLEKNELRDQMLKDKIVKDIEKRKKKNINIEDDK